MASHSHQQDQFPPAMWAFPGDKIASGSRLTRLGSPHTFVQMETFLATFDLQTLSDRPDMAHLAL